MKKIIKKSVVLLAVLLIIVTVCLTGCNKTDKKFQSMTNKISYVNSELLVAEDESFYVEIASGKREKLLVADGEVGEMVNYCTLSVTPIKFDLVGGVLSFKLVGEKGEYSGECKKNIVGINQVARIADSDKVGAIKSLTLKVNEKSFDYTFQNITATGIGYLKAVESVYNNCKEELEGMFDGNKFNAEIYVKVTSDRMANPRKYYWFVNIVENSDNVLCVLVDMESGQIVAKKTR